MPKRIQRKRTKGWRMPENAVSVTRPGRWGNPYKVGSRYRNPIAGGEFAVTAENCLPMFETYCKAFLYVNPNYFEPLRGKDLACWCPPDSPCHADVLLRLANAQPASRGVGSVAGGDPRDIRTNPHDYAGQFPRRDIVTPEREGR